MPYIKQSDRNYLEHLVKTMHLVEIRSPGDLNYLITRLVHVFLAQKPESYQGYNDAIGALEGAKLELYRQHVSSYEDSKIQLNGDVP